MCDDDYLNENKKCPKQNNEQTDFVTSLNQSLCENIDVALYAANFREEVVAHHAFSA